MKTSNFFRIALVAASFTITFACKKDSSSSSGLTPGTTNLQTSSDDQTMASNENDAVSDDATVALTVNPSISGASINQSGKASGSVLGGNDSTGICDATVAFDTTSSTKTVTITYNGTNCWGNRTRTGTVVISVPKGVHWGDQGATVSININLMITRIRDGKSLVINGTKTITNKSGGLLTNLASLTSITHDLTDTLSITFDNGTARTWNVSKERVFTYNNGVVVSTTGTHSDGNNNDIAEWGENRFGISFSSRITAPKVIAQSCDFRLVSGQNTVTRGDKFTAVITYGLDASGSPVTSCPSGSFYANIAWTYLPTGKTGSFIIQY